MDYQGHFINGRWTRRDGASWTSLNPATMQPVLTATYGDGTEVDDAVAAAAQAFRQWRLLSMEARAEALQRVKAALEARVEELALAITTEMGKTLYEARLEAKACVEKVNITLTEGRRLVEDFVPAGVPGACHFLPLGVMAVIGPYNFPAHLANGHIIPALLAGNTVVFKPSSVTPQVGQIYGQAMEAADLPPGVFNLLQISRHLGDRLITHRDVRGVLFTGSYAVGQHIKRLTLEDPWKILALEMGGKNCTLVCDDAHLPQALTEIVMAAWLTTGQRCTRTARVIVHEKLAAELEAGLVEAARQVRGGDPLQADTFMGPLASPAALKGYRHAQETIASGVRTLVASQYGDACFVSPALHRVEQYDSHHPYVREEIFGPDLSLETVGSLQEAIDRANDTDYGLALSIFTRERATFERVMREVPCGVVNWNRSTTGATGKLPFGGLGQSGNHRPSALFAPLYCTYPVAELDNPYGTVPEKPCPGFPAEVLPRVR
ncbi:MAG: aldehyde dehydrogenase family protein [Candidatus Xenobia bacterium]